MSHEQHQEARQTAQESRTDILANYLRTFECDAGRSVLRHLHATAGTRCSSFHPGTNGHGTDPFAAAKRDGGKTLVWFIEEQIEAARRAAGSPDPTDKPKAVSGPRARAKR